MVFAVDDTKKRPFRVVVVGAGIAGLTLSNALQRASINHIVLEKHKKVIYPSGASIGIWPNGSRLLKQLGCLELVDNKCSVMKASFTRNAEGKTIITSELFDEVTKRHGYKFLLLERQEFLKALYTGLPSREPIRVGCAVKHIEESEDGVRVFLADGSYEDGDIVVGCDGVASAVRQMMWDNTNKLVPNSISTREMTSLKTSYKCLVGLSPAIQGIVSGSMTVVHNDGFSFLLFAQPQLTFFFVFIKLDKTHYWPSHPKYSQKDIETEAARLADSPIQEGLVFGDIWEKRLRGELVNIEEGIFRHWHSGRIVIAGDAAHKMTPNIAFGGNSAMESVATLANMLRAELLASPNGLNSHPSQQVLDSVFQQYRDSRVPHIRRISWVSTFITRVDACENRAFKFMAEYCMPLASDSMVGAMFSSLIKKGTKLDYVPLVEYSSGTVSWDNDRRDKRRNLRTTMVILLTTVIAMLVGFLAASRPAIL